MQGNPNIVSAPFRFIPYSRVGRQQFTAVRGVVGWRLLKSI